MTYFSDWLSPGLEFLWRVLRARQVILTSHYTWSHFCLYGSTWNPFAFDTNWHSRFWHPDLTPILTLRNPGWVLRERSVMLTFNVHLITLLICKGVHVFQFFVPFVFVLSFSLFQICLVSMYKLNTGSQRLRYLQCLYIALLLFKLYPIDHLNAFEILRTLMYNEVIVLT